MSKILFVGRQRQITDYSGSGNHIECLPFYESINKRELSQGQAAALLGLTQPKVSAILNGWLKGFSLEKLLLLMVALDQDIEVRVKRKPRNRERGHLRVVCA